MAMTLCNKKEISASAIPPPTYRRFPYAKKVVVVRNYMRIVCKFNSSCPGVLHKNSCSENFGTFSRKHLC